MQQIKVFAIALVIIANAAFVAVAGGDGGRGGGRGGAGRGAGRGGGRGLRN